MAKKCEYSFVGVGNIWIRNISAGELFFSQLGNVNAATFAAEETKLELQDRTQTGGGNCDTTSRLETPTVTLEISNLRPETLAIGLRGTHTTAAAGAQVDEAHTARVDANGEGLLQFDLLPDPDVVPVVTGTAGIPVFVENTDYARTETGIIFLNGGSIADATALEIDYTALGTETVEALTTGANDYEVVIDGVNESKSSAPVAVGFHKVRFSPFSELGFITPDDYATVELVGDVLTDSTKVGAGISKFMKIRLATK